jgi:recombination protein RecA
MCLIPSPIKKGLHGGGHGSHPRNEMKGISSAISDLFRSQANNSVPAKSKPTLTTETVPERLRQPSETNDRKAKFPEKLWSRLDQALRVTDLLLQNGGFGAIVLDMGSLAPDHVLRVPLATWFRYRAAAEQKQTSILLLMQHPCAKSSAGLTLRLPSGCAFEEETTVFSGIEYCAEVVRERFPAPPTNVIPLRKPPQNQRYARWKSRTTWTSR